MTPASRSLTSPRNQVPAQPVAATPAGGRIRSGGCSIADLPADPYPAGRDAEHPLPRLLRCPNPRARSRRLCPGRHGRRHADELPRTAADIAHRAAQQNRARRPGRLTQPGYLRGARSHYRSRNRSSHELIQPAAPGTVPARPKIIAARCGFAGLAAARGLRHAPGRDDTTRPENRQRLPAVAVSMRNRSRDPNGRSPRPRARLRRRMDRATRSWEAADVAFAMAPVLHLEVSWRSPGLHLIPRCGLCSPRTRCPSRETCSRLPPWP